MVDYTKKAVRGVTVTFIGIILSAFFGYLIRVYLARNLSIENFGLFYAVFNLVIFLVLFQNLGLTTALTRFIPKWEVEKKPILIKSSIVTILLIQVVIASILVVILFLLSDFLAVHYFKSPVASLMLKFLSLILILFVFDELLKRTFIGFQNMKLFSFMEFGKNILVFLFIVIFIHFNLGVFSPVYAYILSAPVIFAFGLPFFFKIFPFFEYKFVFIKELTKKLFWFGLPLVFVSFGYKIIESVDILILTYFRSLSEVGIYSVILPTTAFCLLFSRPIALVMVPLGSELWAKKEKEKLADGISRLHKYTLIFVLPLILALFSFSNLFFNLVFGKDFVAAVIPLQIVLVGILFFGIAQINCYTIVGIGRSKVTAKILFTAAIFNLILNLLLIPKFGMYGAAISTAISYIIAFVLSLKYLSKIIRVKHKWLDYGKIAFSAVLFVLMIYFLKKIISLSVLTEAIIIVIIASFIYISLIFLLRIVTLKEVKNLFRSFI